MKKSQKGSTSTTLLIIIIILLIIGFGLYIYFHNNGTSPSLAGNQQTGTTTTTGATTTSTTGGTVSVAGMQEYTDTSFGFSFWYPVGWQVVDVTNASNLPFGATIKDATVVKKLGIMSTVGQTYPDILIQEVHSANLTITDTGGAGPFGPVTYFFDPSTHAWMKVASTEEGGPGPIGTTTADISMNTMGGLHMLAGTSRFDTRIIPLSADNFVVIGDGGGFSATALENTVTATDPSVATPVSTASQIQTIQAEQSTFASEQ